MLILCMYIMLMYVYCIIVENEYISFWWICFELIYIIQWHKLLDFFCYRLSWIFLIFVVNFFCVLYLNMHDELRLTKFSDMNLYKCRLLYWWEIWFFIIFNARKFHRSLSELNIMMCQLHMDNQNLFDSSRTKVNLSYSLSNCLDLYEIRDLKWVPNHEKIFSLRILGCTDEQVWLVRSFSETYGSSRSNLVSTLEFRILLRTV